MYALQIQRSTYECKMEVKSAKFGIGQIVKHRIFPFRGVVFDVDSEFSNSEEWYQSIPEEIRPARNQPFYHILAENADNHYVAYVSEQNLLSDGDGGPIDHPGVGEIFSEFDTSAHRYLRNTPLN
jgi:heat shock protein HspQ